MCAFAHSNAFGHHLPKGEPQGFQKSGLKVQLCCELRTEQHLRPRVSSGDGLQSLWNKGLVERDGSEPTTSIVLWHWFFGILTVCRNVLWRVL